MKTTEECRLDDDGGPEVHAIEAGKDPQALVVRVGPVFYPEGEAKEPGVWIEYQDHYNRAGCCGAVPAGPQEKVEAYPSEVNTDCQFCARDDGLIWGIELREASPAGDYWIAAGCLKQLHAQVFLVCGRHLIIFRDMYKRMPCADCVMVPGEEISYLSEILWERRKDVDTENPGHEEEES